jgi:hypothetical protein
MYNIHSVGGLMKRFTLFAAMVLLCVSLTAIVRAQVPPVPTALPADPVSSTSFTANWTAVTPVDHYVLDVSTSQTFSGGYVGVYHNAPIYAEFEGINGLTSNTVYYYRVRATGQTVGDTSGYSNTVSVLTLDAPTATGATAITTTGFNAHWSSVSGATGYVIDVVTRFTFGGETRVTPYFDFSVGLVTTYAVTGLLPDTTYYFRVRATTSNGEGPSSNSIIVPRILTASPLPSITVGVPFYKVFAGIGGTAPYTWSVTGGSLPTGLTLSSAGLLSGTPTVLGTFNFTVQLADLTPTTVTRSYSLPVINTTTIRFDTATAANIYGFSGSSVSWQHPVSSGSNRMLVVSVGGEDTLASHLATIAVTYNGKALTKATGNSTTWSGRTNISQIWYMREQDLPAAGAYTVVVSAPVIVAGLGSGAISLSNVKQAAPDAVVSVADSLTKNLTATITTLAAHSWLISGAVNGWSGNFYPVANQESQYNLSGEFDILGSQKEVLVAGPDSMLARHLVLYRMSHSVISLAPAPAGVNATAKVYLQGPYNTGTDAMNNSLRASVLAGHFGSVPIPGLAVDSINIEIRDSLAASKATRRVFTPAWLLTDGTIRDFADTTKTYVGFGGSPAGNYYIVISHRNHLAVMSSSSVSLNTGTSPVVYDFSTGQTQAFGTAPMILTGVRYSMIGGNANGDALINALDRVATRNNLGVSGYIGADVNLDGLVNALDRVLARNNLGSGSQVP